MCGMATEGRLTMVKLANTKSDWTEVAGGVPQGTLSGPEKFLNMIDDLHTDVDEVKFVDDSLCTKCATRIAKTSSKMLWMTFRSGQQITT